MRAVFLLLVLANLAFFAWARYFAAAPGAPTAPPVREISPEKLRILPPPAREPRSQSGRSQTVAEAESCIEWGAFTPSAYQSARAALEPLGLDGPLAPRRIEEPAGWWVFLPPQGSRAAAIRKAGELKTLGVHDYFIVNEEGATRWAVSLGVFRSEEAAKSRLEALQSRGVNGAHIAARATRLWLQVRGLDPAREAQLKALTRVVDGSALRGCA